MRGVDRSLTLRFADMGLSLVGGLLFLRLINPAIIFPGKYNLINKDRLTPEGTRGLVISSKILQAMANETEFGRDKDPSMMIMNRFLRKFKDQWRSFFYKLMVSVVHVVVTVRQQQQNIKFFGFFSVSDSFFSSCTFIFSLLSSLLSFFLSPLSLYLFALFQTGEELATSTTNVTLSVTPEDLIARSNHFNCHELICPVTLSKVCEMREEGRGTAREG